MCIHTTPDPDADAPMYLTSSTFTLVSSYILVGLDFISVNMRFQSLNASNTATCFPNDTRFGFSATVLLNGVQRPFPEGKLISE